MSYVALSRIRSLSSLKLLGINKTALEVDEDVLENDQTLKKLSAQAVRELRNFKTDELINNQQKFIQNLSRIIN